MGTKHKVPVVRLEASRAVDVLRQREADGFSGRLRAKARAANPYRSSCPADTAEVVRRVERGMAHAWLRSWEVANEQGSGQGGRPTDGHRHRAWNSVKLAWPRP